MGIRIFIIRRWVGIVPLAALLACGSGDSPTSPPGSPTPGGTSTDAFPGFDTSLYPGDAAMRAWIRPASPYYWSGYYLLAPCHRDGSWTGKRATLAAMGWGITAIYVGQQDWTQIPAAPQNRAVDPEATVVSSAAVCSASLLSVSQGVAEAADAIDKMRADGFPDQSIVFLDVEYVTSITPALLDYYDAWIDGVLKDGRYQPGIYAAKSNANALYTAAVGVYRAAGKSGAPPFWIASSTGFSIAAKPASVGMAFASLWQGMFDVKETWNGVPLTIDIDVASSKSPSTP